MEWNELYYRPLFHNVFPNIRPHDIEHGQPYSADIYGLGILTSTQVYEDFEHFNEYNNLHASIFRRSRKSEKNSSRQAQAEAESRRKTEESLNSNQQIFEQYINFINNNSNKLTLWLRQHTTKVCNYLCLLRKSKNHTMDVYVSILQY